MRDLRKDVEKPIGFDAIMRVRTSTGMQKPVNLKKYGNYIKGDVKDFSTWILLTIILYKMP